MMAMFAVVVLIIISDVDANYHWRRKDVYADTKGEILRLAEALRNNDLHEEMKSTSVKVEDVPADVSDDIMMERGYHGDSTAQ